jgi:hypothetical protein
LSGRHRSRFVRICARRRAANYRIIRFEFENIAEIHQRAFAQGASFY